MLVPPPSPELLARLAELLATHDPLEEGESGLSAQADELLADDLDILERMRQAPVPPLTPNFAGERAYLAIEELVARAAAARRRHERLSPSRWCVAFSADRPESSP